MQDDRLRRHPPRIGHRRRVHRADEVSVLNALRLAGRARRVHQRQEIAGRDHSLRLRVARGGVQRAERAIPGRLVVLRRVDENPCRLRGECASHLVEGDGIPGRRDHHARRRILQQ